MTKGERAAKYTREFIRSSPKPGMGMDDWYFVYYATARHTFDEILELFELNPSRHPVQALREYIERMDGYAVMFDMNTRGDPTKEPYPDNERRRKLSEMNLFAMKRDAAHELLDELTIEFGRCKEEDDEVQPDLPW